jgi:photosystem II stability/assembly factor-like uncharacterized protein
MKKLLFLFTLLILVPRGKAEAQQYEWYVIARPTTSGLISVDFIDTLNGFVARGGIAIFKTTDGGYNWTSYSSGEPFLVYGISMLDTLYGWCAGSQGSFGDIVSTTTGGTTWTVKREMLDENYIGTAALTKNKNLTSGYADPFTGGVDTGLVLRTTNAGTSWQRALFEVGTHFKKVFFIDSLHGWINADSSLQGFVFHTTDGGESWHKYRLPDVFGHPLYFTALTFIDTLSGWGGAGNGFMRTTDAGEHWSLQYIIPEQHDFSVEDISFTDALNGWAFGNTADPGYITEAIYRTTNGGNDWYEESSALSAYLTAGEMLDREHGWAVAGDGRVLAYRKVTNIVEQLPEVPSGFVLRYNYPNPFNPITTIEYEIPQQTNVTMKVVDIVGKEIQTLVNQTQTAGVYRITFDGTQFPSGTYFYTLITPEFQSTKQLLILK